MVFIRRFISYGPSLAEGPRIEFLILCVTPGVLLLTLPAKIKKLSLYEFRKICEVAVKCIE